MTASPGKGLAGDPVTIEGTGFDPPYDDGGGGVSVKWGGPNGQPLGEVVPDSTGAIVTSISIPSNATVRPGAPRAFYQISAVQRKANGTTASTSLVFEVLPPTPAPTSPTVPVATTSPPGTGGTGTTLGSTPATTSAPGAAARRPSSASPAAPLPGLAAPSAPASRDAPVPGPAAAGAGLESPAAALADQGQAPVAEMAIPDAGQLWSAVSPEDSPSLLEAPTPAEVGGSPGWPVLILTAGVGLTGLALAAAVHQRRPVPVRR